MDVQRENLSDQQKGREGWEETEIKEDKKEGREREGEIKRKRVTVLFFFLS